jgi:hypothetical protein
MSAAAMILGGGAAVAQEAPGGAPDAQAKGAELAKKLSPNLIPRFASRGR